MWSGCDSSPCFPGWRGDMTPGHRRNYPLLFAKGLAMGAADVVPGVSGGTIAFISGIYDELVHTLRGLTPAKLPWLWREGPASFWRQINGAFLAVLLAGILTSIFSLARLVVYSLEHHPLVIWSFFFGLIVASIVHVLRQQRHWRPPQVLGLLAGTVAAALVAFSPPLVVEPTLVTVFGAGALAICAMILPGVSGSFILVVIGMYPVVIQAVAAVNLGVLGVFAAGAVVGLLAFSHLLSWLLRHHRATTLAVLVGFMVGSLAALWPWRLEGDAGLARQLLSPFAYGTQVADPRLVSCLLAMVLGLVLVLGLEYLGGRFRRRGNG